MYVNITYLRIDEPTERPASGSSGSVRIMLYELPEWLKDRPGTMVLSVRPARDWSPPPTNWIVCAAVRWCGEMILGPRHFDSTMQEQILRSPIPNWSQGEEGFVDKFGRFFTRREAWPIALASGQIKQRVGGDDVDGGTLYSENLY